MIIEIYMFLQVMAFVFVALAFGVGLFRSFLPNGKGISILLFLFSCVFFIVTAYGAMGVEIWGCSTLSTGVASCGHEFRSYEYLAWLNALFAVLNMILMLVYSLLSFGDLFKKNMYGGI